MLLRIATETARRHLPHVFPFDADLLVINLTATCAREGLLASR
jgi:hypothetical protein